MTTISIINGPNLNLLGTRETDHYGTKTLEEINQGLIASFKDKAIFTFFQSNHEGALVDHVQGLKNSACIVLNPGALTHTSIALRDALCAINATFIEVHLSNIYRREEFRKRSYFSDRAMGVISGLGHLGYHLAVTALLNRSR